MSTYGKGPRDYRVRGGLIMIDVCIQEDLSTTAEAPLGLGTISFILQINNFCV